MQTSYQLDENGEPVVPDILAGSLPPQTAAPSIATDAIAVETPRRSPQEFAAQMQQMRAGSPQDIPNSSNGRQEIADFQNRVAAQQQATAQNVVPKVESESTTAAQADFAQPATTETTAPARMAAAPQEIGRSAADSTQESADAGPEVSASEFISGLNAGIAKTNPPVASQTAAPRLMAQHISGAPAKMFIPESESVADSQVVPVSAEAEAPAKATMDLPMPAIRVETYGPETVGINKPATYQVVVHNGGSIRAERILIGIDLPQWVDIENVNLTTGGKEITDGQGQARLVWSVDQVSGNSTETITITAVPRKAEMFDMGVEWTIVPRIGAVNIQVTQPKLEMNIVGPEEVLYGEQALYHVTVRNPGTGAAENVVVMLPEALGGERANLGDIPAGKDKNFQVELLARTAGELNLIASAVADGNLEISAERKLIVRRANLGIVIEGPPLKYAGSVGQYIVTVTNSGDASANEVVAAMALPTGVKFLGGIDSVKMIEGGLRWQVGSLAPGQTRDYKINCQLDTSGDLQLEVGAQGKGELQAANAVLTKVETVADLVLTVHDPKGPLPTGQDTVYEITVRNRGTRAAKSVDLVMQFSDGIEPKAASGLEHKIVPGQVLFTPIRQIDPGQEMSFKVNAEAFKSGTHVFRAQLTCEDSDSREIAEGTTRFFGEDIQPVRQNTADADAGSQDFSNGFNR